MQLEDTSDTHTLAAEKFDQASPFIGNMRSLERGRQCSV